MIDYGKVGTAEDVAKVMQSLTSDAPDEYVYMFALDAKGKIIGVHEISHGHLCGSVVHPREVFKRALLNNACSIILSHNHPSGDVTPSEDDIDTTKRLLEAGNVLGVTVLDHVIVADGRYCSLRERGCCEF
jgi:DNA repair protein RadC